MAAMGGEVAGDAISSRQGDAAADIATLRGASVLLVEDNEINQQVALEILQGAGLHVTVANDGQEGVNAARKNKYNAILMDIQMPVMDGYTATREIRNLKSEIRNVPIIAMTAHAMAEDRKKCIIAGMDRYITKPFLPDEVFSTIRLVTYSEEPPTQNALDKN